jgi:eukaryotic-like serine/threonine-protein kinase
MAPDFTFLVHPAMDRGAEYSLGTPRPSQLRNAFGLSAPPGQQFALQYTPALRLPSYHDPVPGFEGEWLTAMAPVGRTGFVVLVQTRKDVAFPWLRAMRARQAPRIAAGACLALLFIGGAVIRGRSRRARAR